MSLEKLNSLQPGAKATITVVNPSGPNKIIRVSKPSQAQASIIESFAPINDPGVISAELPLPKDDYKQQYSGNERPSPNRQKVPRIITRPVLYMAGIALGLSAVHAAGDFVGHTVSEGWPDNPVEFGSYFLPNDGIGSMLNISEGDK
jgi:hypothetical protein